MKNSQSIIRLSVLIFLMFGMFQTAQSQTIDSMSKVILDKVEKEYASYETMRYQLIRLSKYDGQSESDTVEVGVTQNMLRIEDKKRTVVSNGNWIIISLGKYDNELDSMESDGEIGFFWLSRLIQ